VETEVVGAEEATVEAMMTASLSDLPEDPAERAQVRLARLRTTFAASLAIVAEMHQDRDWEHLTRDDGTPYNSLAEVMVDVFNVSISMARRYVQGARDFYLPLSELTVEGTRIEITSGDVATLGQTGIADAVDTARDRLDGVEDPDEASKIISDSVSDARDRKNAPTDFEPREDGDFDGYDPMTSSAGAEREAGRRDDLVSDLPDDDGDFNTGPHGDAYGPVYTGLEDDEDDGPAPVSGSDAVEKILAGARTFDSDEDQRALNPSLRDVVRALQTLANIDPVEVGEMIDYENRGVLLPVDGALTSVKRLRATVESSPWFISRMSQA
jgi:hypothetical protein